VAQSKNPPSEPFKSLNFDDLASAFAPSSGPLLSPAQKKMLEQSTSFPSRGPYPHQRVQINVSLNRKQADRLKALLVRDAYSTWSYGTAIEYLMDIEEKSRK
jgi:hypothetical protein